MQVAEQTLYWVKLGGLALAVLVAVIGTAVQVGRTRFSRGAHAVFAPLPLLALVALLMLLKPRVGWLWLVASVAAGAAAGWLLGRARKASVDEQGRLRLRRSPVAPLLLGVAYLLVVWMTLFGTTLLLAWALVIFAAAAGLSTGSSAGEFVASGSVQGGGAGQPVATERVPSA